MVLVLLVAAVGCILIHSVAHGAQMHWMMQSVVHEVAVQVTLV